MKSPHFSAVFHISAHHMYTDVPFFRAVFFYAIGKTEKFVLISFVLLKLNIGMIKYLFI